MSDPTDKLIEAAVACRENGFVIEACFSIIGDVYATPWGDETPAHGIPGDELETVPPTQPVRFRRQA